MKSNNRHFFSTWKIVCWTTLPACLAPPTAVSRFRPSRFKVQYCATSRPLCERQSKLEASFFLPLLRQRRKTERTTDVIFLFSPETRNSVQSRVVLRRTIEIKSLRNFIEGPYFDPRSKTLGDDFCPSRYLGLRPEASGRYLYTEGASYGLNQSALFAHSHCTNLRNTTKFDEKPKQEIALALMILTWTWSPKAWHLNIRWEHDQSISSVPVLHFAPPDLTLTDQASKSNGAIPIAGFIGLLPEIKYEYGHMLMI